MHGVYDGDLGAGIDNVPHPTQLKNLGIHDHPCSVYSTPDELKRGFVPYLQSGLTLGERCIYFTNETSPEFVIKSMQDFGFNIDSYLKRGAFLIIPTSEAHLKGGYFDEQKMLDFWNSALADASSAGFKTLRAAVEMTWALSGSPGCEALAPYEARLNHFTSSRDFSVICMYNRGKFSPEKLTAIIHAHPIVVDADEVLRNPNFIPYENFREGDRELDLQATLDNLALIKQLCAVNAELKLKNDFGESLYEQLQELARVLSHEMQSPLSIITSYLRLLSSRYSERLGPDADEYIGKCVGSARTVARMIDDLWLFARVDSSLSPEEELESAEVLGEALEEIRETMRDHHAHVEFGQLPKIVTRRAHLKYIFKALIENGCLYDGLKPTMNVSGEDCGDCWKFTVSDNGHGIDNIHSQDVFKIFYRIDRKPDATGTGMGLAIAKRMIEHLKGKIWFEPNRNRGTSFIFTLPKPPGSSSGNSTPRLLESA